MNIALFFNKLMVASKRRIEGQQRSCGQMGSPGPTHLLIALIVVLVARHIDHDCAGENQNVLFSVVNVNAVGVDHGKEL